MSKPHSSQRNQALDVLCGPQDECKVFLSCFFDVPERLAARFMNVSYTKLKATNKRAWKASWPFNKVKAGRDDLTFQTIREHRQAVMDKCQNQDLLEILEKARDYGELQEKMQNPTPQKVLLNPQPPEGELFIDPEPVIQDDLGEFPSAEEVADLFEAFPSDEDIARLFD